MAKNTGEALTLPAPPPFMRACIDCTFLLMLLADRWRDPDWGCIREQILMAQHIAEAHPEAVPPQHLDGCGLCPAYARQQDNNAAGVWAQHRARELFLPAPIARLL